MRALARFLLIGQAVYFLVTGVWPLVSIDTFQMVTGPKADLWLVKTVGLLVTVIGVALIDAARRRELTSTAIVLAVGSSLSLLMIDVIYVARQVISPIYLLDAVLQILLLIGWTFVAATRREAPLEKAPELAPPDASTPSAVDGD